MNWYTTLKSAQQHPRMRHNPATQTPAFKAWFGNSQVVTPDGQPLPVYKGMWPHDYTKETKTDPGPLLDTINRTTPFPSFDPKDQEPVRLAGFFTDDPQVAQRFMFKGGAMYAVYLSIQNPYTIDAQGKPAGTVQFGPEGKPFRDAIRSGQYDGVIIRNTSDEANVYIPLHPNQIKSATANNTFNPQDNRIHAHTKQAMPYGDAPPYAQNYFSIGHQNWPALRSRYREDPYKNRNVHKAYVWAIGQDAPNSPWTFRSKPADEYDDNLGAYATHGDIEHEHDTIATGRFEVNDQNPEGVTFVQIQKSPQHAMMWDSPRLNKIKQQVERMLDQELAKLNGGQKPLLILK